jgi:sulfur carrier protein ThiS
MSIRIKPTNLLKGYTAGKTDIPVEMDGKSVRECLAALNIPPELVALVLVNNEAQGKDYIVHDGDIVQLIPVVGGGNT